jgi:cell fate (sporulation/competence/biofilm development) regulator YlbF (YheA/YmcA/DUF963 family)
MSRVKHNANGAFGRQGAKRKQSVAQMQKQAVAFHNLAFQLSEENKALKERVKELEASITSELSALGQEQEKLETATIQDGQ